MLCVVSSTSNSPKCSIASILPSTKKSGKIAFRSHQRSQRERYGATVAHLRRIFWIFSLLPRSRMASQAGAWEIWCNCGAFAPYFFGFSLAPLEVFKGVKFMHITLSLAAFTTVCKCTTYGRGSSTSLLLILFLTGEDGRQGEDKPRPYNGRRSGSRRPSIAGATPVVARCPSTCKSHSAR